MNLRFHLSDDTVEIFELFPKNSGRDVEFPKVLRRQPLPLLNPTSKDRTGAFAGGTVANRHVSLLVTFDVKFRMC
jgi:hypothetical protein